MSHFLGIGYVFTGFPVAVDFDREVRMNDNECVCIHLLYPGWRVLGVGAGE